MRFWSDEGGVRRSYALREGSVVIGRDPSCNIVIPARRVSKKHLHCHVENGVVTIRDLGSSNGTFVNGSPATSCVLNDGDRVSLGEYVLVLDKESQPSQPEEFDYEPAGRAAPPPEPAAEGLSFEKGPSPDDTPADGAFVPQAYAPPQSLQPQIVARDGRMYLRDPRTSREVEIVPRRAGAPADLAGYYAERETAEKKKNTYLILAAIGVGLMMIVALTLTSSQPETVVKEQAKAFPLSTYNAIAEKSIDQMKAGQFAEALPELRKAHKEYVTYQVAGILAEIAEQWQKSGKSVDEFNWLSVKPSLQELRDNRWATSKTKNFASDRMEWIYNVQHQETIAGAAVALMAGDEPEKALAEFDKLPPDSRVRKNYQQQIDSAVAACYNKHARLGREAAEKMDWPAAIKSYQAAEKYASAPQKTEIALALRTIQKRQREEQVLNTANARMREDTPEALRAAFALLEQIDDTSPLAHRKAELRQRIQTALSDLAQRQKVSEALSLYKAGRGPEAIAVITENNLTILYPVRTKVEKLMRLLREATDAVAKKDYDAAKALWAEAAGEEPAADNAYHKAAVDKLNDLGRPERAKEIALEYNRRADVAFEADDPNTARQLYFKAMRWDPKATIGKDGLANLRHLAEITYIRARDLRNKGETVEAIRLFEKVLQLVEEGDTFHQWAKRQLSELKSLSLPK